MPDRHHSVAFWREVATEYAGNSEVVFDLYNEPFPDNNGDTTEAWRCWRDGGTCPNMVLDGRVVMYDAVGMQELVSVVRGTGAANIIMVGGVQYANRLSRWLQHKPSDPTGNLVASWHVYNFNQCVDAGCWDREIGPVAQQVPLITGEIGQRSCRHEFITTVMDWLDARRQSYLGWTWNNWNCNDGPALITNFDGTPTQTYGQAFKDRLTSRVSP